MKIIKTILKITIKISKIAGLAGICSFMINLFDRPSKKPFGIYERYVKRPLDVFLSTGALIALAPVWGLTAILVRTKLGSPVLFTQDRPGKDEKIFKLYKFRSMTDGRDENGELLPDEVRLTPFGKKLRATSLDELPELINIIKGDMALVGPRPLLIPYLPWYSKEQAHRHDVRPGLTGYAQAHGRNAVDWDDKFAMDVAYVNHITFRGDMEIMADTVKAVFKHEGISSATSATMESFVDYCKNKGRKPREESEDN